MIVLRNSPGGQAGGRARLPEPRQTGLVFQRPNTPRAPARPGSISRVKYFTGSVGIQWESSISAVK